MANASLRVRFFNQDADDRIDCKKGADPTYVGEAKVKLRNKSYVPPSKTRT